MKMGHRQQKDHITSVGYVTKSFAILVLRNTTINVERMHRRGAVSDHRQVKMVEDIYACLVIVEKF